MEGEGKGNGRQGKGEKGIEKEQEGKGNQVEKWEVGEGNQVNKLLVPCSGSSVRYHQEGGD